MNPVSTWSTRIFGKSAQNETAAPIPSRKWPQATHTGEKRLLAVVALLSFFGLALIPPSAIAQSPAQLPSGMFHTAGNQIVDQNGTPVRLSCVYWAGMNGFDHSLANLNGPLNGYQANVNAMAAAGFNCIRVDFNNRSLHQGNVSGFLSQLDQVVSAAGNAGMRVIIADHDNEGVFDNFGQDCAAQQSNGIWYDSGGASNGYDGCGNVGTVTQSSYQSDWVSIASRYAGNNTVIGYDLWNEPVVYGSVGSTWGDGTNRDIHLMYQNVGSAMLAQDGSKLIIAACPLQYTGTLFDGTQNAHAPWGDCTGVKNNPVVFTVNGQQITDHVVYDVHLYPNSVSGISSIFGSSTSSSAISAMNATFGFLLSQNIAPVWDGESGTGLAQNPDDQNWGNMLDEYLNGEMGSQGGPTFSAGQQGMGLAWMDWEVTSPDNQDALGILNSDGSLVSALTAIVDPLLYYPLSQGQSPDGTVIVTGQQIIDAQGNTWTISSGVVQENGSNAGYSANVIAMAYVNGNIYQENASYNWYVWQGNGNWASSSNPIGASASGTTITGNPGQYIMDGSGNVWTISSGVVLENGADASYSANVIEIAYVNGTIYQENNANNWWDWDGSTWIATTNPL